MSLALPLLESIDGRPPRRQENPRAGTYGLTGVAWDSVKVVRPECERGACHPLNRAQFPKIRLATRSPFWMVPTDRPTGLATASLGRTDTMRTMPLYLAGSRLNTSSVCPSARPA